jgi:D-alanyl-lipoteichoic acid acyltransferase DltB (MBOAT superfamily)
MIFSSWPFLLVFLPVTLLGYFYLNQSKKLVLGKAWLVLASLFFYAYWNWTHLPLILVSIGLNFWLGRRLAHGHALGQAGDARAWGHRRRAWLLGGIALNLATLAYYKYTQFILDNLAWLWGASVSTEAVMLPLAVSFFTFTQIVYLVDSYRGETGHYDLLNYSLFVTFFPHLIAGPIVQHSQIMPQFASRWTWLSRESNLMKGLFLLSIGLFKKLAIADTFAVWADAGFDGKGALDFYAAWGASLSYTFQLYFDFSGYCDMAMGIALLFNIWLPINFDSPYRSLNIQEFWRRWHITLSHFLRDYVYIPLGGSRVSELRTHSNLLITFALGGLWHGASWMFVIWGLLHGLALVVHRLWQSTGWKMARWLAWGITFLFVNLAWVFFRAKDGASATRIFSGMVDVSTMGFSPVAELPSEALAWAGWLADPLLAFLPTHMVGQLPVFLMLSLGFLLIPQKNALQWTAEGMNDMKAVVSVLLLTVSIYMTLVSTSTVFLYFNF